MILTHPDLDHIGGAAPVLETIGAQVILDPGWPRGSAALVRVQEAAERAGVGWRVAQAGDVLSLDGLSIEVLHPPARSPRAGAPSPESNETSVILVLRFGAFAALLTGDAPVHVEEPAVARSGPVDVLKVGHHGSSTSTSRRFLDRARPEVAVISVGRRNRYGHPHEEVMRRLDAAGVESYRTDRDGTVRVLAARDGSFVVRAAQ